MSSPGSPIQLIDSEKLPSVDEMSSMTSSQISFLILLFFGCTSVNKYVLSELGFTFPTIFQGWQMLAGCLMLNFLSFVGWIQSPQSIIRIERRTFYQFVPAICLNVLSIYSGSVALSLLPVPTFLAIHNMKLVLTFLQSAFYHQKLDKSLQRHQLVVIILIISSSISVFIFDPSDPKLGYDWMVLHIVCSASHHTYENLYLKKTTLRSIDLLYYNCLFSCLILAPATYLGGDLSKMANFQHLWFFKFYLGCVASGILGAFLAIQKMNVRESVEEDRFLQLMALAKLVSAASSLLLFSFESTTVHMLCVLINLCSAVFIDEVINDTSMTTARHRGISLSETKDLMS